MIKKRTMLLCTAAIAIASFAGRKTFGSRTHEIDNRLLQNVEALTDGESYAIPCDDNEEETCVFPAVGPTGKPYEVKLEKMERTSK